MADNVIDGPFKPRKKPHTQAVTAADLAEMPECPEPMVWDVCTYLLLSIERPCMECPRWIETEYGKGQQGCFSMAEEACKTALIHSMRDAAKALEA